MLSRAKHLGLKLDFGLEILHFVQNDLFSTLSGLFGEALNTRIR